MKKEEKPTVSQFLTTMLFPKLLIMLSAIMFWLCGELVMRGMRKDLR